MSGMAISHGLLAVTLYSAITLNVILESGFIAVG